MKAVVRAIPVRGENVRDPKRDPDDEFFFINTSFSPIDPYLIGLESIDMSDGILAIRATQTFRGLPVISLSC